MRTYSFKRINAKVRISTDDGRLRGLRQSILSRCVGSGDDGCLLNVILCSRVWVKTVVGCK
jgi:hypothetical protein